MSKLDQAVQRQLDVIAVAQQNVTAFMQLNRRMTTMFRFSSKREEEAHYAAVDVISGILHCQLAEAWNGLSWFAPISKEAMQYLEQRTKTWFTEPTNGIMGFLGNDGSYYTKDEEAFRNEVLAMFGIEQVYPLEKSDDSLA